MSIRDRLSMELGERELRAVIIHDDDLTHAIRMSIRQDAGQEAYRLFVGTTRFGDDDFEESEMDVFLFLNDAMRVYDADLSSWIDDGYLKLWSEGDKTDAPDLGPFPEWTLDSADGWMDGVATA